MKLTKKLSVIALSMAMVFVMLLGTTGSVFAVPAGNEEANTTVSQTTDDEVQFVKTVTAPAEGVTVANQKFGFTAKQVTADGANFKDATGEETPLYKTGVNQGARVSDISASVDVNKAGDFLVKMNLKSITKPGAYVFRLSEDDITWATGDNYGWRNGGENYLMRVYAKKVTKTVPGPGGMGGTEKEVMEYQVTFVKATENTTDETTTWTPGDKKLEGPTVDEDGSTVTAAGDVVFKNNFTKKAGTDDGTEIDNKNVSMMVQKNIVDESGFADHDNDLFDFSITLTNVEENKAVNKDTYTGTVYDIEEGLYKATETKVTVNNKTKADFKLKGNQVLVFDNIPAGTKITTSEGAVTVNNCKLTDSARVINGETVTDEGNAISGKTLGEKANSMTVTNTYEKIDVTGVALRIMPFLLIGLVAVAGAFVYRRAKKLNQ